MSDKQMRITVDKSPVEQAMGGLRQQLSQISQESKQMMQEMYRESRAYTTSYLEANRYVKERIRDMREQLNIQQQMNTREVNQAYKSGEIGKSEYTRRVSDLTSDKESNKQLLNELQAIHNAILKTSREEIIKDRVNVEKQIASDDSVKRLSPEGDPAVEFKKTYQAYEVGRLKEIESKQEQRASQNAPQWTRNVEQLGSFSGLMIGSARGLEKRFDRMDFGQRQNSQELETSTYAEKSEQLKEAGSRMPNKYLAAAMAIIGGSMALGFRQLAVKEANLQEAAKGGYGGGVKGSFFGLGMSQSEAAREMSGIVSATNMGAGQWGDSFGDLWAMGQGSFLGTSGIGQLVSLRRYGAKSRATGIMSVMEGMARSTGQDVSVINEMAPMFAQGVMGSYMESGKTNEGGVMALMERLNAVGLRGQLVGQTMGKIQQGNMRSGNPVIQALQMEAAREVAGPNASFWDIQKIMADPMNPEYMSSFMGRLKQVSGGGQAYEKVLSDVYKLNPNVAENIAGMNINSSRSGYLEDYMKESRKTETANRGYGGVGELMQAEAAFRSANEATLAEAMKGLTSAMNKLIKNIDLALKPVGAATGTTVSTDPGRIKN